MKKQFLLAALIGIAGICLCTNNQNSLKACNKEAAAGSIKIENEVKINPTNYTEDDDTFYKFINPVTQL